MRILMLVAMAAAGSLAAPAASAQSVPGIEFVGCWATPSSANGARLCVLPASGPSLRFVTIASDGSQSESSLRLDGGRTAISANGCTGWEQARPSADRERLVVDAEITCGTGVAQKRTTVFSITPLGYFLQTTGTGIAMVANTQVQLFLPIASYLDIPSALRDPMVRVMPDAEIRRLQIRGNAVSARDLVELDAMDVAGSMIDVVVAASYPQSFVIDGTGGVANTEKGSVASGRRPMSSPISGYGVMGGIPMLSMYDWEQMRACAYFGGYTCGYGLSALDYGRFGYGNGYYGFGYGYPGYWPSSGPVVVRPVQPPSETPGSVGGGRAVRGRGYTQNGGDGMPAAPRTTTSAPSSSTGSSSSGSSSAGASSGASSGGRTAKPRDP